MKKTILFAAILFASMSLNAQTNSTLQTFESALIDYNVYKTKSQFNKLVESAIHDNNQDLELLKSMYNKDNLSNADQLYEIIERIDKRELVLMSNNSKYKPLQFDELTELKNNLSNFYSIVGSTYNKSEDKLDAIVSYKALKKAKYLNNKLDLESQLKEVIKKVQTKIFITFEDKQSAKSHLKSFKEIVSKYEDEDLIKIVDDKSKSDLELKVNIASINQQAYLTQFMRNGAVINDVIHNSEEVQFNRSRGFGQISTTNFYSALLNEFDNILRTNNKINYLEFKNHITYQAEVVLPSKRLKIEDAINDQHLISTANIKSLVWSDFMPTDDRKIQLVLNDIYNSIKNDLLIN